VTPRYASRADGNQAEIVAALRRAGASVTSLHRVGQGCPDLLVGYRGITYLMEVKTDNGKLTEPEDKFIREWEGLEVAVIHHPDDALTVIGAI